MSQKTKYLYDNKQIANILAEGFAKICQQKPKFPINYLSRYLKNHTIKSNQKTFLIDRLESNKKVMSELDEAEQRLKQEMLKKLQVQKVSKLYRDNFLSKITQTQRHEEILNLFCQWINDRLRFAGVYIGELQNQVKEINTIEQDGQQAHLQLEKQKVIKFKFASEGQKRIVVGNTLSQDSVVGRLLNETQEQGNAGEQQAGQENKTSQVKGQLYIPSVVGSQQLRFFRFPRLGAYFSTSLTIKCYLSQKLFDENVVKVQSFSKVMHDYQKEMEQKQAKFKQVYDQRTNAGAQQKQLQELEKQFEREKSQIQRPSPEQLSFYERKFVICFDTMGLDRQITQRQKQQIRELKFHLKQSWQSEQKRQTQKDIRSQISLLKPNNEYGHDSQIPNYAQQYNTLIEQEQKQITSHEQVQKVKDNEKLFQLQSNTVRIQKTKQYMSEEKYLHFWDHLLQMNVIKYPQIIRQLLVLLGFSKDEFSFHGTNVLDWFQTKKLLKNNRTRILEQLASTNPRGSKPQLTQPYAKCSRIDKNLQGLEPATISGYNIYLALIFRFLQLYTKIRRQDREARVAKIQSERENREQKLNEAEQKQNAKQQKMEALKAELQEKGQLQAFDQQAWNAQYQQENPPVDIPEQVQDDFDRDLDDVDGELQNMKKNQE